MAPTGHSGPGTAAWRSGQALGSDRPPQLDRVLVCAFAAEFAPSVFDGLMGDEILP